MDIENDDTDQEIKERKRKNRKKYKNLKPLRVNSDAEETENVGDCFYHGINIGEEVRDEVSFVNHNDESSRVVTDAQLRKSPEYNLNDDFNKAEWEIEAGQIVEEAPDQYSTNSELVNKRPLSKYANTYELEKFEKNAMVILNQENINRYEKRKGSARDVAALTKTFEQFGFEVKEHLDLTRKGVFDEMDKFFAQDFSDYGCIAIAVLTHGSSNGKLLAKDISYYESEIIKYFKVHHNPSMVTKPKILIIQACRGKESRQGIVVGQSGLVRLDQAEEVEPYSLPMESDMVVVHSSYIGKPSHRDEVFGSWFIQSLCTQINKLAKIDDFLSILGIVNKAIAIDKELKEENRGTSKEDINKQTPIISTTLMRKLYLKKYDASANTEVESSMDSSTPVTPLMVQFGPCSCFLDYFEYMKNCLRYLVEENPDDAAGRDLLILAETFEGDQFNSSKERLSRVIRNHFEKSAGDHHWYKYVHIKHL